MEDLVRQAHAHSGLLFQWKKKKKKKISDVETFVLPTCPLNVWINDVERIKPAVLSQAMGT
jgi:hypothetical protein